MNALESLARLAEAEAQLNAAAPLGNSDIEEDSFADAIAATDFAALLEYVRGLEAEPPIVLDESVTRAGCNYLGQAAGMTLRLAEVFTSIQGEGHLTGKPMRFIRFAGCAVAQCPLHPRNKSAVGVCDTDWSRRFNVSDLAALAREAYDEVGSGGWVCITGGEPLDQPGALAVLVSELKKLNLMVNIQTSGTRWVTCPWDWLTVSPKCAADDLVQTFGQELKLVYTGQSDDELRRYYDHTKFWNYYLMPLWHDGSQQFEPTRAAVMRNRGWELTTQAHKWWGVR